MTPQDDTKQIREFNTSGICCPDEHYYIYRTKGKRGQATFSGVGGTDSIIEISKDWRNRMIKKLNAIFDGRVLCPDEPIEIAPNTRVSIIIEAFDTLETNGRSFLQTAQSLNLKGPSDWSVRFEDYLYGRKNETND